MRNKNSINNYKRTLFALTIALVTFGLVMIYNASVVDAIRDFGNKYYYFQLQAKWTLVGLVLMLILSRFPPQKWQNLSFPLWIVSIILLVAVLIPGIGNNYLGARRWISLGGFTVQPAEAAKFATVIYLAAILSKKRALGPLIVSIVLVAGLIILEPDLGTSLVLVLSSLIIYFASGAPIKKLILIMLLLFISVLGIIAISPYRRARIQTYLDPSSDPQGSSYHIRQALIAFGSGGLTGLGLGQSRQKYQYLPEVTTDSIFAIIGEELGFVGSTIVILLLLWFIMLSLGISLNSTTGFQRLLGVGLTGWIAVQFIINLGSIIGLFPLTGVPLPFISYGGSSLVVALASVGVILSLERKDEH